MIDQFTKAELDLIEYCIRETILVLEKKYGKPGNSAVLQKINDKLVKLDELKIKVLARQTND